MALESGQLCCGELIQTCCVAYTNVDNTFNRLFLVSALPFGTSGNTSERRERGIREAPVPVTRTKLVYLVPTLVGGAVHGEAQHNRASGVSAWRRQTHKSEAHRNNIPISFLLEIIMLCQCSFDSRCNLYRYNIIFCFSSCFVFRFFFGVQHHGSPSVQSDSFNRSQRFSAGIIFVLYFSLCFSFLEVGKPREKSYESVGQPEKKIRKNIESNSWREQKQCKLTKVNNLA